MKCRWKMVIAVLLVLVMLVPLSLSCGGGGGGGGKVTIHIGQLTDFTGAASPALKYMTFMTQDMIRYYNDENLIPGVRVKLDAYDTRFDPSRYSLGYDWCKQQGAKVIHTIIADAPIMLKPFAARDKVVIAATSGTPELFDPPGWVFGFSSTSEDNGKILLHWIRQNDWKGEGVPKIGMVGWDDTQSMTAGRLLGQYLDETGEYEFVGRITTPQGTSTFTNQAKQLKDKGCDYIVVVSGFMFGPLLRDLRAAGSQATLLDCIGSMGSFQKMYVQMVGWDMLDGCYCWSNGYCWRDSNPIVDLVRTLANRYHSAGEAADLIASGNAYIGPAFQLIAILEVLQQAVKNVGAENFDGQAYFDAAISYKTTSSLWEGYPEFSFSETRRKLVDHAMITGFEKDVEDYVTLSDWLPDIID